MFHRPVTAAALALVLFVPPTAAQERPFPYEVGHRDAVLAPVAVGVSVLGIAVTGGRDPLTRDQIAALDPSDLNGFDRTAAGNWSSAWATASDWTEGALLGGSALVTLAALAPEDRWRHVRVLAVMGAEAGLLLGGVTYTVKGLAGRKRPFLFNTSLSVDERVDISDRSPQDAYYSFFSGHTAAAFAVATFVSTVVTDLHGRSAASDLVWVSSLSVAGLTAYARVKAGMHYPSDVLVGAAVGTAIGVGVPWLHRAGRGRGVQVTVGPGGVSVRIPR